MKMIKLWLRWYCGIPLPPLKVSIVASSFPGHKPQMKISTSDERRTLCHYLSVVITTKITSKEGHWKTNAFWKRSLCALLPARTLGHLISHPHPPPRLGPVVQLQGYPDCTNPGLVSILIHLYSIMKSVH